MASSHRTALNDHFHRLVVNAIVDRDGFLGPLAVPDPRPSLSALGGVKCKAGRSFEILKDFGFCFADYTDANTTNTQTFNGFLRCVEFAAKRVCTSVISNILLYLFVIFSYIVQV